MKFRIVGADRQTGEDMEIVVDARDEVDAETIANRRNIIVSSVVLVRSLPPEPQQSPPIGGKQSVKQCPKCKEWINKGATKCPHCRSTQPAPPWAYAIVALLVVVPALWCCGPCSVFDSPDTEQARRAAAEKPRPSTQECAHTDTGRVFLRSKLAELDSFKSDPMFHEFGFSVGGPFHSWLDCVESKRDAAGFSFLERVAVGDLQMLGLEYVTTRGRENDYTRYARESIARTIRD